MSLDNEATAPTEQEPIDHKEKEAHIKRQNEKNKQLQQKIAQMEAEKQQLLENQAPEQPANLGDSVEATRQAVREEMQQQMQQQIQQQKEQKYTQALKQLVSQDQEAKQLIQDQITNNGHQVQALDGLFMKISEEYKTNISQGMIKDILKNENLKNKLLSNISNPAKVDEELRKLSKIDHKAPVQADKSFAEVPDLSQNGDAVMPLTKADREKMYINKWMNG